MIFRSPGVTKLGRTSSMYVEYTRVAIFPQSLYLSRTNYKYYIISTLYPPLSIAGTVFMDVGSSLKSLPLEVSRDEGLQLAGVKPTGINTQGVAGCICYKFKFIPRSFCIMFKVPYSGDNYWNIKVYSGTKRADKATFDELVSSSPFKAGTPVGEKQISDGVFIKDASMTTSGQSILTILVGISS